jgi:4a-hydroxytetrahydrobiopterin dehydratase
VTALTEQKCRPCQAGEPPLSAAEAKELAREAPAWSLTEKAIEREFKFKDFREAMGFVNKVADIAEDEGHHPDIRISWNRVKLTLTTHKIGGLSRNDFIVAAKVDRTADSGTGTAGM